MRSFHFQASRAMLCAVGADKRSTNEPPPPDIKANSYWSHWGAPIDPSMEIGHVHQNTHTIDQCLTVETGDKTRKLTQPTMLKILEFTTEFRYAFTCSCICKKHTHICIETQIITMTGWAG